MKVLWLFAHPEQRSLNASLRDDGIRALEELGHECRLSDLYSMGWNPVVDHSDYRPDSRTDADERLLVARHSKRAYLAGELSDDVRAEQEKILWADTVVMQFPLWWHGMPAILKGWFDRVLVKGFAYGIPDPQTPGRSLRYGDGALAGRRAMIVVTAGAAAPDLGPRGVSGDINELLFPVQHGSFWYTGMSVVPPFVVTSADRVSDVGYKELAGRLRERLLGIPTAEPIPFRRQDSGDYDEDFVLRDCIAPGQSGIQVHTVR
ncbi:NAD(P)H-dependent oxidoreductase [Streptomyces sp. NPDC050610]|uniref:NAD(P)H-dependent oxidoreductase n=1 Tax=Streptomyces sp. NPDC050610 TaxID=3157097 RepID=UPI00341A7810